MPAPLKRKFQRFIVQRSRIEFAVASIVLAALVGWVDDVTGMEVSVALLYLIPIWLATDRVGRWLGIAISVQSAIEGFIAGRTGLATYSNPAIPYWNTAMMLGFYLAVAYLLDALKAIKHHEEDLARNTQINFLPKTLTLSPRLEVAADWKPSVNVGGDYFDLLKIDDNRFGVCIADISGHGIPAALLMSNVQSVVRLLAPTAAPAEVCARVNTQAFTSFPDDAFLTFFYGILDLRGLRFTYCNAGHNHPVMIDHTGRTRQLFEGGVPLGIRQTWKYVEGSVTLSPGDRLVLYTDGITEARNPSEELFGEDRLMNIILHGQSSSPDQMNRDIISTVLQFCKGAIDDDITLMNIAIREQG